MSAAALVAKHEDGVSLLDCAIWYVAAPLREDRGAFAGPASQDRRFSLACVLLTAW